MTYQKIWRKNSKTQIVTKLKHSNWNKTKKNSNSNKAISDKTEEKNSLGINNLTPQQMMWFSEGSLLQSCNASVWAVRIYIFLQDAAGPVNRALHCKAWSTSRVNLYPDCIYKLWLDRVISGPLFILIKNLPSHVLYFFSQSEELNILAGYNIKE